jgi:hypothetical protein
MSIIDRGYCTLEGHSEERSLYQSNVQNLASLVLFQSFINPNNTLLHYQTIFSEPY